jgi:hypothetical protein
MSVLDGLHDVKAVHTISLRDSAYQNEYCLIFTNIDETNRVLFGINSHYRYCEAIPYDHTMTLS